MSDTKLVTIDQQEIITAAQVFVQERDKAMSGVANTAKAAITYGSLLGKVRETMSGKQFDDWLLNIVPQLPIHESIACMKVAAKYAQHGKQLFLERTSAAWAQAELGLLPPGKETDKPTRQLTPADALNAIERLKQRLAAVFEAVPLRGWTEEEQTLLHSALAELDIIGDTK